MTYIKKLIIIIIISFIALVLAGCNENEITTEKTNDITAEVVNYEGVSTLSLADNSFTLRPTCVEPNKDPVKGHYPKVPAMKCEGNPNIFAELAKRGADKSPLYILFDSINQQVISLMNDETMNRHPVPTAPAPASELLQIIPASVTKLKEGGSNCLYINVAGAEEKICENNGNPSSEPQRTPNITEALENELRVFLKDTNLNIDMLLFIDDNNMIKILKSRHFDNSTLGNLVPTKLVNSVPINFIAYKSSPTCHYENINGTETLVCSKN